MSEPKSVTFSEPLKSSLKSPEAPNKDTSNKDAPKEVPAAEQSPAPAIKEPVKNEASPMKEVLPKDSPSLKDSLKTKVAKPVEMAKDKLKHIVAANKGKPYVKYAIGGLVVVVHIAATAAAYLTTNKMSSLNIPQVIV